MTKAPKPPGWSRVESRGSQVLLVYHDFKRVPWEQWYLLRSDVHWDNPKCRRDLLDKHSQMAVERGAGILDFGDFFCAMQGKYDKRASKDSIRPEHQNGDYLDSLVRTAAEWAKPYAKNWLLVGDGNHETGIRKAHESDLLERLCGVMRDRHNSPIHHGGYTGWVRFYFRYATVRTSRTLWYTHGYGGGGPVTKDMIQENRQQVYVRGADFMVSGHTHHKWSDEQPTIELNYANNIERRSIEYIKLGTYKDAYDTGQGGFEVEKGHGPRPLGSWWLRFYQDKNRSEIQHELVKA